MGESQWRSPRQRQPRCSLTRPPARYCAASWALQPRTNEPLANRHTDRRRRAERVTAVWAAATVRRVRWRVVGAAAALGTAGAHVAATVRPLRGRYVGQRDGDFCSTSCADRTVVYPSARLRPNRMRCACGLFRSAQPAWRSPASLQSSPHAHAHNHNMPRAPTRQHAPVSDG
jgi:hypothetical protein